MQSTGYWRRWYCTDDTEAGSIAIMGSETELKSILTQSRDAPAFAEPAQFLCEGHRMRELLRHENLPLVVRYLAVSGGANILWEFAHMPLYSVWWRGTNMEIIYNGLHCTVGDIMIAFFALLAGIVAGGWGGWPRQNWLRVSAIILGTGVVYTAFSEWFNTSIRNTWSYSELMPVIPGTGIGLSPIAQWTIIPTAALLLTYRQASLALHQRAPKALEGKERANENA